MKLSVRTTIEQQLSEDLNDQVVLNNIFSGIDSAESGEFKVEDVDVKQYSLNSTSGPALSIDVFSDLSISPDKVSFIHAYAFNNTVGATECPDPVKFDVSIGDGTSVVDLGKMSQFEMANMEGFNAAGSVVISNVDVASEKSAGLIIIVGSIK